MHYLPPGDYLPHDTPMLLLESVESVTNDRAVCSVTVNERGVLAPFWTRTATCWLVCAGADGPDRGRLV